MDRGEAGAREPRHHGRNRRRRRAAAARAALGVDLGLDAVVEVDKCPEADDLERKLALLLEPDAGRAEEGARDAVPGVRAADPALAEQPVARREPAPGRRDALELPPDHHPRRPVEEAGERRRRAREVAPAELPDERRLLPEVEAALAERLRREEAGDVRRELLHGRQNFRAAHVPVGGGGRFDGGLCLISATVGRRGCGSQQERRHVVPHDTDERLLGLAGRVGPESDLPLDGRNDQKELAV